MLLDQPARYFFSRLNQPSFVSTSLFPYWLPSPPGALLADPRNCGGLEAKLTTTTTTSLFQGAVARTNSRDTIYQAEISPVCDEPAPVIRMPCVRQLAGPSDTISGGASGEGGGGGGSYEAPIQADLLRFTV